MLTKSTRISDRNARAYFLLAGIVLATLVVGLMMVFADAKPAHAIGETWYGTLQFEGTGNPVALSDGSTYTDRSYHRFEAPESSAQATVDTKVDQTRTYPAPPPGTCRVVERHYFGSGYVTGNFSVGDAAADGFYTMSAYGDYYQGIDSTIPVQEDVTFAGTNPDGTSCARTEHASHRWSPFGDIQSYQNPKTNYRVGSSVTPSLNSVGNCQFYGDGREECADMQSYEARGPVRARWSVSRNQCSGYSRSWNLGKDDKLFLFNTCQTKSLSARTSFLDDVSGTPEVCNMTFVAIKDSMADALKKKLNRACTAYKAILRVEWATNDWFLYNAANWDACGVWVVDDASWRPPKVKTATRASDGQGITKISPGRTEYVKTATGSVQVSCPG